MRKALITGVTGQDGSYLAELLLQKGYEVHGLKRRSSSFNTGRVDHIYHDAHQDGGRFFLHFGDLSDSDSLAGLLYSLRPDEVYNLGAQSHVKVSFGNLDARRDWGYAPDYVRAMWLMLQQDTSGDYVIGTGEAHSVRDFCKLAFAAAGLHWEAYVEVDPCYFRPAEVDCLCADP